MTQNPNSVSLIRKAIILLTVLIVLVVFLIIFQFTDIAFRVWDRIQHTPPAFIAIYLTIVALIAAIGLGLIWENWTVWRHAAGEPRRRGWRPWWRGCWPPPAPPTCGCWAARWGWCRASAAQWPSSTAWRS